MSIAGVSEGEIARFLMDTPGFFERHAEALAAVRLTSPHGARAVSLQERQMEMLRDKIMAVLDTLSFREREIIKLRYGIGDGYTYTLEEVGRIFKVTRERVRQIEAKAVRKLQHPVRARKLEGFLDSFGNE